LIVVRIAHWQGPFYLKSQGSIEGVYVRLGSTNRVAGVEIIDELKRLKSKTSFDQLPCHDVDSDGLDMARINKAFLSAGRDVNQSKLVSLGVLVSYAGKLLCSNGGLILFGQDALRERYFPNATVRCARFAGKDKVDFIDQLDIDGTIIEAMKEIPKFVRRHTRLAAKIEQIRREDIPEYSLVAIREVLTNALVHADYSIRGMNPRVAIFSDRLVIESPGMLPFGYTLDDFMAGVSHVRNKVIARVFRELHLMEEWGTGFKRISESCNAGGYTTPTWEELGSAIRVTLHPHLYTTEGQIKALPARASDLSIRQQEVLSLLQKHQKLTAKEIINKLSTQISERTVRSDLLALKNQNLVEIIGKGPNSFWKVFHI
jgi:ATP-dependent DNA helicase RecG